MARRRMIDPNFWQSEDISRLSVFERLLFVGMFSNADDTGRGRANPNYLKSTIFPYDDMRAADVDKALSEISHNTSVILYEVANNRYYAFTNWEKWQRVDKPQPSQIPAPPESAGNDSGMIPESVGNDSCLREKKEKEEKEKSICAEVISYLNQKAGTAFKPGTPKTLQLITARQREGFTLADFKIVVDKKCAEWKTNGDMCRFLRPETLFGTKFEGYLNQLKSSGSGNRPAADKKAFSQHEYTQDELARRRMEAVKRLADE